MEPRKSRRLMLLPSHSLRWQLKKIQPTPTQRRRRVFAAFPVFSVVIFRTQPLSRWRKA